MSSKGKEKKNGYRYGVVLDSVLSGQSVPEKYSRDRKGDEAEEAYCDKDITRLCAIDIQTLRIEYERFIRQYSKALEETQTLVDAADQKKPGGFADIPIGFHHGVVSLKYAAERISQCTREILEMRYRKAEKTDGQPGNRESYTNMLSAADGVEITKEEYGYRIRCKFRFPSRYAYKRNIDWWFPVASALREYAFVHRGDMECIRYAYAIYVDYYPQSSPQARVTDADNQDIKNINDALNLYRYILSDNSLNLKVIQGSSRDEGCSKPYTEIYVTTIQHVADLIQACFKQ